MNLQPIIDEFRAMHTDMAALGNSKLPTVDYFRIVRLDEHAAEVRREADENGCIVATKGEAVIIMPWLPAGWTQISGTWRKK